VFIVLVIKLFGMDFFKESGPECCSYKTQNQKRYYIFTYLNCIMTATPTASNRSLALDIFRGMTICFMIIVNNAGSEELAFSPLLHAHWHGFTPTDLVFPSFLFAVGNAMSFVMAKWNTLSQAQVLGRIFRRTAIIFLCGFFLYWFPFYHIDHTTHNMVFSPVSHTRILGVL